MFKDSFVLNLNLNPEYKYIYYIDILLIYITFENICIYTNKSFDIKYIYYMKILGKYM